MDHVARGTLAAAEEKLLPGGHVSKWPVAICGQIERMHPRRKGLQFPLRKRKSRHPAWCSIFDQVANLPCITSSQVAIANQSWPAIPAASALAVAAFAELFELFFSLTEICILTDSLACCQQGHSESNMRRRKCL